ncbi:acyltransferase [Stenotrophomonas sp. S41]|uniref:acyltransferase family protein n=1 Tax=Stenotrophomonas sp. S41 TaxID=2767464 RepID=UPI001909D5AF|nr:acyltransferase [Stenotrophomonas sp. S41]MBK0012761.1 acyltransferase [Stenotrophomonas sp. S41]
MSGVLGKLVAIQWLRATAAIAVVWFHALLLLQDHGIPSSQGSLGGVGSIGAIGVDIFFVVSGFIISITAERARSVQDFALRRFVRVWPLYALATFFYVILVPSARGDLLDIAFSMAMFQPLASLSVSPVLPTGWTLLFEAFFYALVACAIAWKSARPLSERVLMLLVGCVLFASTYGWFRPMNIWGNPICLEFGLGVLIGCAWRKGVVLPHWAAVLIFSLSAVLIIKSAVDGHGYIWASDHILNGSLSWERFRVWGIPAALLVVSAALRQPLPHGDGRLMQIFGDASYSIYLFHLHFLRWLGQHIDDFSVLDPDALVFVATAGGVAVGVVAHYVLERPLLKAFGAFLTLRRNRTVAASE